MPQTPLRLLLVAPLPPPVGGIARWTSMLLTELTNRADVTVTHVDSAVRTRPVAEFGPILRLVSGIRSFANLWPRVRSRVGGQRFDCAHLVTSGSWGLVRDLVLVTMLRRHSVPTVVHVRCGRLPELLPTRNWEARLFALVANRASAVVVLDSRSERALKSYLPAVRSRLIPNFAQVPVPADSKRERTFLFVGHVIPAKGVRELLEAWRSVSHSGWRLVIAGPMNRAFADDLKRDFGELPGVQFTGELTSMESRREIERAGVVVLPSYTEGFPNVVLEAMMAGTAVIATDVGAIPDMLSGDAGIVIAPKNSAAVASALDKCIQEPETLVRMGQRARSAAVARYSPDAVIAEYLRLWSDVSRGRRGN